MIPKIIHYCWLSNEPIPEELQNYMKSWRQYLPDYEFVLWNFERFDKSSSKWVEQAFDNKKYAFAADYIRLYAIYNYGGIYMDMDIEVLQSFDGLLDTDLLLAFENDEKNGIEAGCFGAKKENPFIGECLNYYKDRFFIKGDGTFDMLPLPKIMMKFISNKEGLTILDRYTFTCKSYEDGNITRKDYSYAIHNFAGSWTSKMQQKYDKKRHAIYQKYGKKVGKILLVPFFLQWQFSDNGIEGFLKKVYKRIRIF